MHAGRQAKAKAKAKEDDAIRGSVRRVLSTRGGGSCCIVLGDVVLGGIVSCHVVLGVMLSSCRRVRCSGRSAAGVRRL